MLIYFYYINIIYSNSTFPNGELKQIIFSDTWPIIASCTKKFFFACRAAKFIFWQAMIMKIQAQEILMIFNLILWSITEQQPV